MRDLVVQVTRRDGFTRQVIWHDELRVVTVPDAMLSAAYGAQDYRLEGLPDGYSIQEVLEGYDKDQEGLASLRFRLRKT